MPHTRLALDEGVGAATAPTDGGALATLAAGNADTAAYWLPAGRGLHSLTSELNLRTFGTHPSR